MNFFRKYSIFTLAFAAILIGVLWRLELEHLGWEGLTWVSYYHYAVPAGLLLFIVWANLSLNISLKKRIWLNGIGLFFGMISFYFIEMSLRATFIGGPSAMFLMELPTWKLLLLVNGHLVLLPFLVIGSFIVLKLFKLNVSWVRLGIAIIIMIGAAPVSIWLLGLIGHQGSHDVIHTLKSGIIIPFIVFAVGLVFVEKSA